MKHEMSRRGILDELWREKFGYCRCIPLPSSTYNTARQARVGGRCRGQSWTRTEYIAELLTPLIHLFRWMVRWLHCICMTINSRRERLNIYRVKGSPFIENSRFFCACLLPLNDIKVFKSDPTDWLHHGSVIWSAIIVFARVEVSGMVWILHGKQRLQSALMSSSGHCPGAGNMSMLG